MKKMMVFLMVAILLNGVMTMSLPGIMNALAWETIPTGDVRASLPQPGEYLYQTLGGEHLLTLKDDLPVTFEMWFDCGGCASIALLTDEDEICEAVALFADIRIAGETDEWVTDNYNGMRMTFADGTSIVLSLNLKNLELRVNDMEKLYELENLQPFWRFMQERAVEQ